MGKRFVSFPKFQISMKLNVCIVLLRNVYAFCNVGARRFVFLLGYG